MHWDNTAEFSFGTGCRRSFAVDEWYWAANFSVPLDVAPPAMKGLLSGLLGTDQNSQLGTKCVSCCCTSRMPAHVHINMKHLGYTQCYLKKETMHNSAILNAFAFNSKGCHPSSLLLYILQFVANTWQLSSVSSSAWMVSSWMTIRRKIKKEKSHTQPSLQILQEVWIK